MTDDTRTEALRIAREVLDRGERFVTGTILSIQAASFDRLVSKANRAELLARALIEAERKIADLALDSFGIAQWAALQMVPFELSDHDPGDEDVLR